MKCKDDSTCSVCLQPKEVSEKREEVTSSGCRVEEGNENEILVRERSYPAHCVERCLTTKGTTERKNQLTAVDESTEKPMYDAIIDNWAEKNDAELFH